MGSGTSRRRRVKSPRQPGVKGEPSLESIARDFSGQRGKNDCFVSGVLNISSEFARRRHWPQVKLTRNEAREITLYQGTVGSIAPKVAPAWTALLKRSGMHQDLRIGEITLADATLKAVERVIHLEQASFPLVGVSPKYQLSSAPPYRVAKPPIGDLDDLPDHVLVAMRLSEKHLRAYDPFSHRGAVDGGKCIVDIPAAQFQEWWHDAQAVRGWMVWIEETEIPSLYAYDEARGSE